MTTNLHVVVLKPPNTSSLFVIIIIILEQLPFSKSKFRLTSIFCFAVAPCTITKLTERYSILYTSLLSAVVGLIRNYMTTQTLHSILFSFFFFEHLFNFYTWPFTTWCTLILTTLKMFCVSINYFRSRYISLLFFPLLFSFHIHIYSIYYIRFKHFYIYMYVVDHNSM